MLSNLAPKLATHFCEFCDFPCWYSEALRCQSGIPPSSGRAVCSCQCYRTILFVTPHLQDDEVCRLCCFSCTTDFACRNICTLSEYNKIHQFSSFTHIVQAKGYSRSSVDIVTLVMQSWAPLFFLGVMDAQRQAAPAASDTWMPSGLVLGQKALLCTVVRRVGAVPSPKDSI